MTRRSLLCLSLIALLPVDAAMAGTLSGKVTSLQSGAAVDNYQVDLYNTALSRVTSSICTAGDGTYAFTGLSGTYKVHFTGGTAAGCAPSTLAPQWYANRFSFQFATGVSVSD